MPNVKPSEEDKLEKKGEKKTKLKLFCTMDLWMHSKATDNLEP